MILSSVLLPLPFGPITPKNSPRATENDTSCRASCCSDDVRLNGWRKSSFTVVRRSCGSVKAFETPSTSTAGEVSGTGSNTFGKPGLLSLEEPVTADQREEGDRDGQEPPRRRVERTRDGYPVWAQILVENDVADVL